MLSDLTGLRIFTNYYPAFLWRVRIASEMFLFRFRMLVTFSRLLTIPAATFRCK
jgi:hypothetical protein